MRRQLLPALRLLLVLTVVTGVIYPLVVTGIAQIAFPHAANGSLVERDGTVVGSRLQGQPFTDDEYFHPRPSAAGDGYDGSATAGSNYGPTNREFLDTVRGRVQEYRTTNGMAADVAVPADAVTASGSGLDPHISIANARLQAPRVAAARDRAMADVLELITRHTQQRALGILGEPGVNVLHLNLALDESAAP